MIDFKTYQSYCLKAFPNLLSTLNLAFSKQSALLFDIFSFYHHLKKIPPLIEVHDDIIHIGNTYDLTPKNHEVLTSLIHRLIPWKKGPYSLFGQVLDSEWQCQLKWKRLKPHLPDLSGKRILDIGCNSGYFLFQCLFSEPSLLIGLEPHFLFFQQYCLLALSIIEHYPLYYLPIRLDEFEDQTVDFILDMGVLYHQKDPLTHLALLKKKCHSKTIVFLETLIYKVPEAVSLSPYPRYAAMKNVFFIPSLSCLKHWCLSAGFSTVEVLDVTMTTSNEQRSTALSSTMSLKDFLNPLNNLETIEGYQAPCRAILKLS